MNLFHTSTFDDRDRPVLLLAPHAVNTPLFSPLTRPLRHRIQKSIRRRIGRRGVAAQTLLIAGACILAIAPGSFLFIRLMRWWMNQAPGAVPMWLGVAEPVFLIPGLLVAMPFISRFNRRYARQTIDAFLDECLCPSCAYHLANLTPDPADGCTICPECSAVWKLPASVARS